MKSLLAIGLVPALLWMVPTGESRVSVRIVDAATGEVVPAMVCITGMDGQVRLPPDGRVLDKGLSKN